MASYNHEMGQNRTVRNITLITLAVLLAWGAYALRQFERAFGVKDNRVVQILESPDRRFRAELTRRHAFLDLNFIIHLNGREIFVSQDFDQTYKVPFRETILWDVTGNNLIFEIGGDRLFEYNVVANKSLTDDELLKLKVRNPQREDFAYQRHWPGFKKSCD